MIQCSCIFSVTFVFPSVVECLLLKRDTASISLSPLCSSWINTWPDYSYFRQAVSASFQPSTAHFSSSGVKRSTSEPLNFNPSLASMVANASSQNEAREAGLESNISESDEDQESASSIISSARAYSDNGVQSPRDSDEQEGEDSRDLLDFIPTETLDSQETASAPFSGVFGQVEIANSI